MSTNILLFLLLAGIPCLSIFSLAIVLLVKLHRRQKIKFSLSALCGASVILPASTWSAYSYFGDISPLCAVCIPMSMVAGVLWCHFTGEEPEITMRRMVGGSLYGLLIGFGSYVAWFLMVIFLLMLFGGVGVPTPVW